MARFATAVSARAFHQRFAWLFLLLIAAGNVLAASPDELQPRHRPDRLILKPKADVIDQNSAAVNAAHAAIGARIHRRYPKLRGIQVVQLPPGRDLQQAIAHYRATGLFEYVEPDYEVHVLATPNDPYFLDGSLYGMQTISAPAAWDTRTNAPGIIVAVIDTGVDYTHPDLAANLWTNSGEIPGNGIDDDGDGYVDDVYGINAITGSGDPKDDHFHGTHCAGTIGAVGNNGLGVVGVVWQVRLMACKFLDATGSGYNSDAIECINFAVSKGAHIMSNSWGGGGYDQSLRDAIAAARDADIIFVAAAGNNGTRDNDANPFYPASYDVDNIIAVAATDQNDQLASFSHYGADSVDLGAPGVGIWSTFPTYPTGAITNSGFSTNYFAISGTSMATPHVAGALAIVRAEFPSDTYTQSIWRVLGNVDPLTSLSNLCLTGGRLNLYKALTQVPVPLANFTAAPTGDLTCSFTDTSIGAVTNRTWSFGDGSPLGVDVNPTHLFPSNGYYDVTLTVFGLGGSSSKTRTVALIPNYYMRATAFSWVDPSGMTALTLGDDEVSAAQALPFPFTFYGQVFSNLFVSSNGMLGFGTSGMDRFTNGDLPTAVVPNNALYPFWDDLYPPGGGTIRVGTAGAAPNRVAVVSWVGVPHWPNSTPTYTFQVLLHERGNDIVFQYQEIQPSDLNYGAGRSATIGVEDPTGTVARKYSYDGSLLLTNSQAILFTMTPPSFEITSITLAGNDVEIAWTAVGDQGYVVQAAAGDNGSYSNNFMDISPVISVPGTGLSTTNYVEPGGATNSPARFYRVRTAP